MSTDTPTSRRLAAILAADIAGYSALVGADEEGTVRALKGHQAVVLPLVGQHGGRVIDTAGDGIMAEFGSVIGALKAALAIQAAMAERNTEVPAARRLQYRIGINLGDVIFDETRIYGDGINVAARLEGLAEPGGVCVSAKVHDESLGKVECAFEDMGEKALKNIARPVRVYRVRSRVAAKPQLDAGMLTLPDKPSIAVLPFTNMSGDPEQEYFADGVVEDILTALARVKGFFVIARNSSFTYKGRAVDVKQVGRELGVRYVLEGSVRKSGNRVRITAQLIEAESGAHIWADKYDGQLEEIFDLQDQITASVVGALEPMLIAAEGSRIARSRPSNISAYDAFLRANAKLHVWNKEECDAALSLLLSAIQSDPSYALAYAMAAQCHMNRVTTGVTVDFEGERNEGIRLARRAIDLGPDDPATLCRAGHVISLLSRTSQEAVRWLDRSLTLNPNSAIAYHYSGWVRGNAGDARTAIDHFKKALRLSPRDPNAFLSCAGLCYAFFLDENYPESIFWGTEAVTQRPTLILALRLLAAAQAAGGEIELARMNVERLRELAPGYDFAETSSHWEHKSGRERYLRSLELAGAEKTRDK